jgi:hypothetical protein
VYVTERILEHMPSYDMTSGSNIARNLEFTMVKYFAVHSCSRYLTKLLQKNNDASV